MQEATQVRRCFGECDAVFYQPFIGRTLRLSAGPSAAVAEIPLLSALGIGQSNMLKLADHSALNLARSAVKAADLVKFPENSLLNSEIQPRHAETRSPRTASRTNKTSFGKSPVADVHFSHRHDSDLGWCRRNV